MKRMQNRAGSYEFLAGIGAYSSGVIASPGYEIEHVRLAEPLPYREGFNRIAQHFEELGLSRASLCAIELRLPAPLSFKGFAEFNEDYRSLIDDWGLLVEGVNPIARTNIAPGLDPPDEPSLYAFSHTLRSSGHKRGPTFVVAGAGDVREGPPSEESIVSAGETGPGALREKAEFVVGVVEARLAGLGAEWSVVTTANVYTVHPLHAYLEPAVLSRMGKAASHGVCWYFGRPPILGLEFEMDARGVWVERMLD